jgi:hypothetical protein
MRPTSLQQIALLFTLDQHFVYKKITQLASQT